MDPATWINLGVALGIGLLVGAERERRKGEGPSRAPAGVRTFAVASLVGAVSQHLGGPPVLAVTALGVAILVAVAYWRRRDTDPGLTTEVALILVILLGGLAIREPLLASALGVTLAALLFARERLHHFVRAILTERELNDALILAAAALVVLPIIPDTHIGPFRAINPRTLWMIVVLVMSMGALGHVARRILGPRYGLPVTGLAGGFVSSVATIGSMGQVANEHARLMHSTVAGAALSSVATIVQMIAVLAVTSRAALSALMVPLVLSGVVALAYGAAFTLRGLRGESPPPPATERAFSIKTALLLAATVSFMLLLAAATQAWLGQQGMLIAAALAGFADSHAAAASVASLVDAEKLEAKAAIVPVLAVLTTNALTKAGVALASNRRFALEVVPGLILMIAAAWLGAWWVRAS